MEKDKNEYALAQAERFITTVISFIDEWVRSDMFVSVKVSKFDNKLQTYSLLGKLGHDRLPKRKIPNDVLSLPQKTVQTTRTGSALWQHGRLNSDAANVR